MTGFKCTADLQTALLLIGGMVRNLLLFGGSRSGKTGGAYGREVYGILGKMGERLPGTAQYPGIPSLPELPDYENRVVRNKPPKYRSRTVVRLVMPAAWAGPGSVSKMGLVQRRPCRAVLSKMRLWCVQNGFIAVPSVSGSAVQNESVMCPNVQVHKVHMVRITETRWAVSRQIRQKEDLTPGKTYGKLCPGY